MRESAIVRKIISAVKRAYPTAWVCKLADRFTRGVPDLCLVWPGGNVVFVEVKRPGGQSQPLQDVTRHRITACGIGCLVVASVEDVLIYMRIKSCSF